MHHEGKCSQLHGHSYKGCVFLKSETLVEKGSEKNMVMDFARVSDVLDPMVKNYLDHQFLNETLNSDATTAEFIAKWIFDYLKPHLPRLWKVEVFETASCSAAYFE